MNKEELINHLQSVINAEYAGQQASFAQDKGISAAYLNDVLKGRREPDRRF
jgi:DNA-binding transcriptional regulator YdaS (Cro superfamily)